MILIQIYGPFLNIVITRSIVQNCGNLLERPKSIWPCVSQSRVKGETQLFILKAIFPLLALLPNLLFLVQCERNWIIIHIGHGISAPRHVIITKNHFLWSTTARVSKHDNLISVRAGSTSFFSTVIMAENLGSLIRYFLSHFIYCSCKYVPT